MAAGHYTALLYTQFVKMIRPNAELAAFPFDYIETKALEFYDHKFGHQRANIKGPLYEFLSLPFSLLGQAISAML